MLLILQACDLSKLTMKMKESGVLYAIILIHADDKNRDTKFIKLKKGLGFENIFSIYYDILPSIHEIP